MPVLAMVDTPMVLPPMPMVPTTERGLLMPSPRLMLMPTTLDMVDSMVDMDMLVLAMVDTPMVLPPMPMVPTTERGLLMPSPRLMPTMALTDMVSPMPMVPMPMASKMSSASV